VVRVAGATAVAVPLTPDGRHDVEAMAAAVTPRTRAVLVCTPNNPTGTVVTADELAWLLQAVPDEVLVVVDEAYAELVRDPQAADGIARAREHTCVAALRTFSKAYGLAGLRVGYGVMAPAVARALRSTSIPFGVSSVAQAAAVAALSCEAELLARVELVVAERVRVLGELRTLGWQPPASEANFVWLPLGPRAQAFAQACEARGVAVRTFPGEGVRVTVAEPEASDRVLAVAAGFPAA
jgi:histidinol-phosphate aminotransferase